MSKKIIIYGAYDDGNFGDDLLLFMILDWLEEYNFINNIYVSSSKSDLKKHYKTINLLDKNIAKNQSCDLFIMGGGTQFFSFKKDDATIKSNIFTKISKVLKNPVLLYLRLKNLISVKPQYNKKIAIGIGLGPFENKNKLSGIINNLKSYDDIFVRDKIAKFLCDENDVKACSGADICFSDYFVKKYNFIHIRDKNSLPKIGIVLREWSHNGLGSLINNKIIEWINKNKHKFKISIFLFSQSKDHSLFLKLIKSTNIHPNIWNLKTMQISSYLNELNKMDIFIASRFHSGVINVNLGIPTICLGIDPKLSYLVEEVNGFYYLSIDQSFNLISSYIQEILKNYKLKQDNILESKNVLNSKANIMFKKLNKYLK